MKKQEEGRQVEDRSTNRPGGIRPPIDVDGGGQLSFRDQPQGESRRRFLMQTGGGIAFALGSLFVGKVARAEIAELLGGGKKLDVGSNGEKVIEEAYRIGYEYEKRYGGCAQCTVAALQDSIDFVAINKDVFRAASCLDGGATPTGLQNCGSFTGSGMIIGYLCGRRRDTFGGKADLSHKLIHKVYEKFKEQYGSVLCRDVRQKMEQYPDKCPRVVGRAARWTAEVLLTEFTSWN